MLYKKLGLKLIDVKIMEQGAIVLMFIEKLEKRVLGKGMQIAYTERKTLAECYIDIKKLELLIMIAKILFISKNVVYRASWPKSWGCFEVT